jgi:NitT/TauT family transport system substrate-binding protein
MKSRMRRACTVGLAAFAVVAALGRPPGAAAADKITLGVDWQIFGRHAGFVVAQDKGFYKAEGLDVEVIRGYGAADAVKRIAAGTITIGTGDTGALVISRSQGIKVKAVGMVYGKAPYVLWIRKDVGVKVPKDLEGKTIGSAAGSVVRLLFPAFAKLAGVDASKVNWATIDAPSHFPMLFSKKVDAVIDYIVGLPTVTKRGKEAGVEIQAMLYADYGLNIYSNALMVREDMLQEKPDVIRKILKASYQGYDFAVKNPAEAAAIVKRRQPELDEEPIQAEIVIVKDLVWTPEALKHGAGYMDDAKMRTTRDIITQAYELKAIVPHEELYTNALLSK